MREIYQNSDFFFPNRLDLSCKGNRESQSYVSSLACETFLFKLSIKLRKLVEILIKRKIARRLKVKIQNHKPISPADFLLYRAECWAQEGKKNFESILESLEGKSLIDRDNINCQDTGIFTQLLFRELLLLKSKGKLNIVPLKGDVYKLAESKAFIFFDSYYFFNGGHTSAVELTLDNLKAANNMAVFVFVIDRRMILFPQLANLVLQKYDNCLLFDATNYPIRLPDTQESPLNWSLSQLQPSLDISKSSIYTDSIFNPYLYWNSYDYGKNLKVTKAWHRVYSRNDSKSIVEKELRAIRYQTTKKPYVVIHTRSSELMPMNIRNSTSIKDKDTLLLGLLEMGLRVIILGIGEPSPTTQHPDIIYGQAFGSMRDDFQIHILNGAIGIIGSPSGITHLNYCTDTPTLLLDAPFPLCNCFPNAHFKVLLKKLKNKNNQYVDISHYYRYSDNEYLELLNTSTESPLHKEGIKLVCNANSMVVHAFKELLRETYTQKDLLNLDTSLSFEEIDQDLLNSEKTKIEKYLDTPPPSSSSKRSHPLFPFGNLSSANWLYK